MVEPITRFAGGAVGPARNNQELLNPRALFLVLWRQKWLIGGIVGFFTLAAVIYALLVTPIYKSQALIKIEPSHALALDIPELAGRFEADASTIESEIKYLTSNSFVGRIVDEQRLLDDAEYNPNLLESVAKGQVRELFSDRSGADLIFDATASVDRRATIRELKEALSVSQVGRSFVLAVTVASTDPAKAAQLANAFAETYLVAQLEDKFDATNKAAAWLTTQINSIRDQVIDLENQLVVRQTNQGIYSGSGVDPLAQQIIQLNARVAEAQAARAETEARYAQVQNLLDSRGGISAAANVLTSPLLSELRGEEAALQRRLAELATIYGDRHPQIVNARAELASQRAKIRSEVQRILSDLQNEVAVATARERELQSSLQGLQNNVASQERGVVNVRELEREALSARATYERYLQRLAEVNELQNLQEPDAVILSQAQIPLEPAFPQKRLIVLLAFFGSAVLAIGTAFLVDRWTTDLGYRAGEELLAETGHDSLTAVPELDDGTLGPVDPDDFIVEQPLSVFGEAIQRLRTNLYLLDDGPCRSLLVTSSIPGEGKTLIVTSLARQSAKAGIKALLIDADMRRPRVHEVMGRMNGRGLSDVLTGRVALDEALQRDDASGLTYLPAGPCPESPADLLRSRTMKMLLADASNDYDLVLIDSPPIAAVSDSAVLADLVDRTVYVVRWNTTPRKTVIGGLKQLDDAGARIAGTVLSMVDLKKQAQYGYDDIATYQGYYGERTPG